MCGKLCIMHQMLKRDRVNIVNIKLHEFIIESHL